MVEQFTYFNSVKQSTISISFEKVDYFTFWLGRLFYKVDQNVVPRSMNYIFLIDSNSAYYPAAPPTYASSNQFGIGAGANVDLGFKQNTGLGGIVGLKQKVIYAIIIILGITSVAQVQHIQNFKKNRLY